MGFDVIQDDDLSFLFGYYFFLTLCLTSAPCKFSKNVLE